MKERVVITGLGTINPIGDNVDATWASVQNGVCGVAPITHYGIEGRKVTLAAELKNYEATAYFDKKEARRLDPFIQYALIAAREALAAANFSAPDSYRVGTIVASGIGGLTTIEAEDQRVAQQNAFDRVTPFFIPMVISNMAAAHVAMEAHAQGVCTSVATACASSTNAIGDAYRQIRDGYLDAVICGGSEASITPLAVGGFTAMRALHSGDDPARASVPFDVERSGFVMGEGAAVLVLESLSHAEARQAPIIAEVIGYGTTCDANHITAPQEDGEPAKRAMLDAIADAGLSPADIDYVNAHGTSTPMNDRIESMVLNRVFGEQVPPVSSTKALTGHLLGASGALEAVICAKAVAENRTPLQFGVVAQDPDCAIPLATETTPCRTVMSNSLGFGGHNASIILRRWEA